MKLYSVGIKEIHIAYVEVRAESEEEARRLVAEKYRRNLESLPEIEYDDTLKEDEWYVREIEDYPDSEAYCYTSSAKSRTLMKMIEDQAKTILKVHKVFGKPLDPDYKGLPKKED